MKPTLLALTLLVTLLIPPLHASHFSPEQEARIKELVRQTLVQNPAILEEAAESWEKQLEADQSAKLERLIKENQDILFNSDISPRLGAKHPKLTLVSFSDYNCPYCKQFEPNLLRLLKNYPDDIAVVTKFLPFKGKTSALAAQYTLSLWQQDPAKFLALHEKLMSKQGMLSEADIENVLAATGNKKLKPNGKATEEIHNSLRISTLLGVRGTPATLVGDNLIPGAISYEELEDVVKTELKKIAAL